MSNLKLVVGAILIIGSVTFAETIKPDSFQAKAVKSLHNKGILKSVFSEEEFKSNKSINRYQVATMIYNLMKYDNDLLEKANESDISLLKALIADLSSELGNMGVKTEELNIKLDLVEKRLEKRMDNKLADVYKEIDKVKITADFSLNKDLSRDDKTAEYKEIETSGRVTALLNPIDGVTGRVRYNLKTEETDVYELIYQNDDVSLDVFKSETKDLPTFESSLGIFDGNKIENTDGIVFQSKLKGYDATAISAGTSNGQINGIQMAKSFDYFDNDENNADSRFSMAYININPNDTDFEEPSSLLSLQMDFNIKLSDTGNQQFSAEYSQIFTDNETNKYTQTDYSLPIQSDTALNLYAKTTSERENSYYEFVFGGMNTGRNYDLSKTGDVDKQQFAEADFIKPEKNSLGLYSRFLYEYKDLKTYIAYGSFGSNYEFDLAYEQIEFDLRYEGQNSSYGFNYKNVKPRIDLEEFNKDNNSNITQLSKLKGRDFYKVDTKLNSKLFNNVENRFAITYFNDNDIEESGYIAYADYLKNIDDKSFYKLAVEYRLDYEHNNQDFKNYKEYTNTAFGASYERDLWFTEKNGAELSLVLGGRYDKKDYEVKELSVENSKSYRVFTNISYELNDWKIELGGKYQTNTPKLIDEEDDYFTRYGGRITYKPVKNWEASLTLGPMDIFESNQMDEIIFDRTDGNIGDQNQASFTIKGKF